MAGPQGLVSCTGYPVPIEGRAIHRNPSDPEKLYGPLLGAFDKAIPEIAKVEGSFGVGRSTTILTAAPYTVLK